MEQTEDLEPLEALFANLSIMELVKIQSDARVAEDAVTLHVAMNEIKNRQKPSPEYRIVRGETAEQSQHGKIQVRDGDGEIIFDQG